MLASGRGQSGREMMCTVISFVSFLFIFVYSHQPQFVLILRCFNTFSSAGLVAFMFGFCYFKNHIYIYIYVFGFCFVFLNIGHILIGSLFQSLSLSFSGRMASFPRYCMSFATSLCQSDQ